MRLANRALSKGLILAKWLKMDLQVSQLTHLIPHVRGGKVDQRAAPYRPL